MSSRTVWYGITAVIVLAIAGYGIYTYLIVPTNTPSPPGDGGSGGNIQNITLYGGEVSSSVYGWGLTSSTLKSPGPTLNFTVGTPVHLSLTIVGSVPHAFAIYSQNNTSSTILFKSSIGSASNPLLQGDTKAVSFTPTQAGEFYYICPVPGHLELGMWGRVKVVK